MSTVHFHVRGSVPAGTRSQPAVSSDVVLTWVFHGIKGQNPKAKSHQNHQRDDDIHVRITVLHCAHRETVVQQVDSDYSFRRELSRRALPCSKSELFSLSGALNQVSCWQMSFITGWLSPYCRCCDFNECDLLQVSKQTNTPPDLSLSSHRSRDDCQFIASARDKRERERGRWDGSDGINVLPTEVDTWPQHCKPRRHLRHTPSDQMSVRWLSGAWLPFSCNRKGEWPSGCGFRSQRGTEEKIEAAGHEGESQSARHGTTHLPAVRRCKPREWRAASDVPVRTPHSHPQPGTAVCPPTPHAHLSSPLLSSILATPRLTSRDRKWPQFGV